MKEKKRYKKLSDCQSWFIQCDGSHIELRGAEAMDYLSEQMILLQGVYRHAQLLRRSIKSELDHYEPSDNIITDSMDLDETLSHIELCCRMFIEHYDRMYSDIDSMNRRFTDLPF